MAKSRIKILTCFPDYILDYGIGYAAAQITLGMKNVNVKVDILCTQTLGEMYESNAVKKDIITPIKNKFFFKVVAKFFPEFFQTLLEKKFYKICDHYDVVYMWPNCPITWYRYAKQKNKIIVSEFINCHQQFSKNILDLESKRLGIDSLNLHAISQMAINDENEKIELCDFIFSPSPCVTKSLTANGVLESKIIDSSYGLIDREQLPFNEKTQDNNSFIAIFVARGIYRKGLHLLLQYWDKANVKGTLKIIGRIAPEMSSIVEIYQQNQSIEFIDFASDLEQYYANSALFILPSLEEGSPLVIYQAIGAGLPSLVSPMGGGGVVRDKVDGLILDPHDQVAWVEAIQMLAKDTVLRKKMARMARERSNHYIWSKVAVRRLNKLMKKLQEY